MHESAPPPATLPATRPDEIAASRAVWLVVIFFAGLMLVVGLKFVFAQLHDDLGKRSANERARLFIGEEIVRQIKEIERDTFYMTTLNGRGVQLLVEKEIGRHVDTLRNALRVLKEGGTVRQVIDLNIEGHDEMVREATYTPGSDADSGYVMELIEIAPLLEQIGGKVRDLRELLDERAELREKGDQAGLFQMEQHIAANLKHLPPFFHRINENANRLFYESNERLSTLEKNLDTQRSRYNLMETLSVILVIVIATLAGILFARQIRDSNRRLGAAWEEMRLAKEEAERASRAKSDFVSRMSHELRTPMNAILGFGQLLQEEDLDPEHRDYVNEINRAGGHLLELINQVLDLAKIEAGRMTLESIPFDPMQTVDEVATVVAEQARDKGLKLRFFASPQLPSRILGDPTRLRQVLINLVGNAVKFTEAGTIDLRVERCQNGAAMRFTVEDSGIGMDSTTLARLFKPFSQADESMTRRYGGTGLGLMISKDLVQAMGGSLEVDSEPGVGSRFWFEMGVKVAEDAPPRPTPLAGYGALLSCGEAHQIEVISAQLEALGATIMPMHGLDEATRLIEAEPSRAWVCVGQQTCLDKFRDAFNNTSAGSRMLLRIPGGEIGSGNYDAFLQEPFTYTRLLDLVTEIQSRQARSAKSTPTANLERMSGNGQPVRVLLVEDNRINQMVAMRMLEKLGVRHDVADNGSAALDMLGTQPYDLVLMDVQMPVMDGLDATRAWRERELARARPRLPIIAMTANAMIEDREQCLAAGMDDHIAKPIEFDKLAATLSAWLARGA
jgi:signal transduction histidine kinase/CheY-like chemotaxis protein